MKFSQLLLYEKISVFQRRNRIFLECVNDIPIRKKIEKSRDEFRKIFENFRIHAGKVF